MASPRAITALSGAALAAVVGAGVRVDATRAVDRAVRRRIHPRKSPALRSLAEGISYLLGPHTHPFVAATLAAFIRHKNGKGGLSPIVASLSAFVLDNTVRTLVHQRRPPRAGRHRGRARYGYPSGHVTAATAISIATASDLTGDLTPAQERALWSAVVALCVAVGWARLYLDEHWIDDVVGGWCAGIALGFGATLLPTI